MLFLLGSCRMHGKTYNKKANRSCKALTEIYKHNYKRQWQRTHSKIIRQKDSLQTSVSQESEWQGH